MDLVSTANALPAHYDPKEGSENVRKLEALETYYRKAKDATKLYQAVEAKLGEQRHFIVWWDGLGDKRGRAGSKILARGNSSELV